MQQDITDQLVETEQLFERLKEQAEQEAAMVAILPVRFEANIVAFDKYMPEIAVKFKNYAPIRSFRFFCSDNGIPNILWLDTNIAQYGNNPYDDCLQHIQNVLSEEKNITRMILKKEENFFNQIHVEYMNRLVELNEEATNSIIERQSMISSSPLVMMFGVGLGYQLGYLCEKCDVANLFVFEPDLDLFYASLYTFDWAPFLEYIKNENKGFHLFLGQDEESVMNDLTASLEKRGQFLVSSVLAFHHYRSEKIDNLIDKVKDSFFLLIRGWGFFDDNLFAMAHSAKNISSGVPFLIRDKKVDNKFRDVPVFIVGNGPSLDSALPYLKKLQNDAVIVSCGSSISALHRAGIKPDIYVSVERTKSMSDFLTVLNDRDYLKDILYLSTDVTHPEHIDFFDKIGLGFKFNEPMFSLLSVNFPEIRWHLAPLQSVNPLVGNIGLSMPITLGFQNLYLFGLDNGHKDREHHHSKLSAYYDNTGKQIDILSKSSNGNMSAPGNFGGTVITNPLYMMSAHVMNNLLAGSQSVKCFNCSDGVMVDNAIPLPLNKLKIMKINVSKKELMESIFTELYQPLQITIEEIQDKLDIDYFNYFIDKVNAEWELPIKTQSDVILRMQQQYEYLVMIAKSPQHHIYRVLVGTFNYVFSLLGVLLYRFNDFDQAKPYVERGIAIIQEYLAKTKELYPHALECQDMSDYKMLKHFRKN